MASSGNLQPVPASPADELLREVVAICEEHAKLMRFKADDARKQMHDENRHLREDKFSAMAQTCDFLAEKIRALTAAREYLDKADVGSSLPSSVKDGLPVQAGATSPGMDGTSPAFGGSRDAAGTVPPTSAPSSDAVAGWIPDAPSIYHALHEGRPGGVYGLLNKHYEPLRRLIHTAYTAHVEAGMGEPDECWHCDEPIVDGDAVTRLSMHQHCADEMARLLRWCEPLRGLVPSNSIGAILDYFARVEHSLPTMPDEDVRGEYRAMLDDLRKTLLAVGPPTAHVAGGGELEGIACPQCKGSGVCAPDASECDTCGGSGLRGDLTFNDIAPCAPAPDEPISMVLHCPNCSAQHVDAPEPENDWTNPPHRSHKCHACEYVWRPADVPTTGVEDIETKGKNDSPLCASLTYQRLYEWHAKGYRAACAFAAETFERRASIEEMPMDARAAWKAAAAKCRGWAVGGPSDSPEAEALKSPTPPASASSAVGEALQEIDKVFESWRAPSLNPFKAGQYEVCRAMEAWWPILRAALEGEKP